MQTGGPAGFLFDRMATYNPLSEPHWRANRERVARLLLHMISKLRTPGMRSEFTRHINTLSARANNPTEYIAEAVEDARYDLMLIAGIAGDLDSVNMEEAVQ